MEIIVVVKVIFSLLLVIISMYGVLKLIQKYGIIGSNSNNQSGGIKIESVVYIDANTKVLNLRKDKNSYIIAINKNNILLIDKLINTDETIK